VSDLNISMPNPWEQEREADQIEGLGFGIRIRNRFDPNNVSDWMMLADLWVSGAPDASGNRVANYLDDHE
jgi:hypothetical protein